MIVGGSIKCVFVVKAVNASNLKFIACSSGIGTYIEFVFLIFNVCIVCVVVFVNVIFFIGVFVLLK